MGKEKQTSRLDLVKKSVDVLKLKQHTVYDINVIINKVACTLVRAKYFSQNFSAPLKKFLRAPLATIV